MKQTTTTTEPKSANLNMLFQDLIYDFANLITKEKQTKEQLIKTVEAKGKGIKAVLFIQSIKKSDFETIRLCESGNALLFNQ